MVEYKSPNFRWTEKKVGASPVIFTGAQSDAVCGFSGYAYRGPTEPYAVASMGEFEEVYGGRPDNFTYPGSCYLFDSVEGFFKQVGSGVVYVQRFVGAGAAAAQRVLGVSGGPATVGSITSDPASFPVALAPGDTFIGNVDSDAMGPATLTIAATPAEYVGPGVPGATYAACVATNEVVIAIAGYANQTIQCTGAENTQALWHDLLNANLIGAYVINDGGESKIVTDQKGSGAAGSIVSGDVDVLAALGWVAAAPLVNAGPNNVADVLAVGALEWAGEWGGALAGLGGGTSIAINADDSITWTSLATGVAANVQFTGGTGLAKIAGLAIGTYSGAASSTIGAVQLDASSVGTWGDDMRTSVSHNDITGPLVSGALAAGAQTRIPVASINKISIGDQISITKGVDVQRGVVKYLERTTPPAIVLESAITVPGGGYAGTETVKIETWNLSIYDSNMSLVTTYANIRMSALAGANYVVNKINSVPLTWVEATVLGTLPAIPADQRPLADASPVSLAGGNDGAAVAQADVQGSSSAKTGLYAWLKVDELDIAAIPGLSEMGLSNAAVSQIISDAEAIAEAVGEWQWIWDLKDGLLPNLSAGQIVDWKSVTMGIDSSHSMCWFPWLVKAVNGIEVNVPNSGYVLGTISRTWRSRSFGKAPAGTVDGKIEGIIRRAYDLDQDSYNYLYPNGINGIMSFKNIGVVGWGNNTADALGVFAALNERFVFNRAKRAVREIIRAYSFEYNDDDTRSMLKMLVDDLMAEWQGKKILAGQGMAEGWYFLCDRNLNTASVIKARKIRFTLGLAANQAAEFVEGTIEQDLRALSSEMTATV